MEVIHKDGFGRCAVASRDLEMGDTILVEEAAMYWPQGPDELVSIVQAYLDVDDENRQRIDQLSHEIKTHSQELDDLVKRWVDVFEDGKASDSRLASMQKEQYLPILMRAQFNAHAVQTPDGACLFPTGAMLNHSCSPNAFYRCDQHSICFTANRRIAKGTEITASYLDAMTMLKPTRYRQEALVLGKGFICECERCGSNCGEMTRPVNCPTAQCDGYLLPIADVLTSSGTKKAPRWACHECKVTLPDEAASKLTQTEERLYASWMQRDSLMSAGGRISPKEINKAISVASTTLHPTHFLAQFERVLAIEIGGPSPGEKLQLVSHAFTYADWLYTNFHPAVPSNLLGTMTGALAELFDRKTSEIRYGLDIDRVLTIFRTVLPLARLKYGKQSAYVKALEAVLSRYATCSNLICSNTGKLSRCGRCNAESYCSRSCQVFHFKSQGHKAACLQIVEARKKLCSLSLA